MATYYCRSDGSAANKAAATGPTTSAAACMNEAVFNGETFSAGDVVVFSNRGGNYTPSIVVPSGGSGVGNEIEYKGETDYLPLFTGSNGDGCFSVDSKNYVILRDLRADATSGSTAFFFGGTSTGVITHNLDVVASGNQGLMHADTASVVHNNVTVANCADEGITSHGTNTYTINGGTITDCNSGFQWIGTATITAYDVVITGVATFGFAVNPAASNAHNIHFERCHFTEGNTGTGAGARAIDAYSGNWTFKNCIWLDVPDADYYLLARSGVTTFNLINCVLVGASGVTVTGVYNADTDFVCKNTIFEAMGTQGLYGATGTIDHNLFHDSGDARGTNSTTADPDLDATGRIQGTGSGAYDAGIGPGSDADIPTDDIDGDTRSGATCDIGADEYVSGGGPYTDDEAGTLTPSGTFTRLAQLNRTASGAI